jgi:trans-aconitate methyltransferase
MSTSPELSTTENGSIAWYSEVQFYDFENPANKPADEMIGHFTQMVWKDTCKIGCGWSGNYMVCRYSPAGNILDFEETYVHYIENVCPMSGCPAPVPETI